MAQDFKLHTRRWQWLRQVGLALARLARMLGAREYVDAYQRDLGPIALADMSTATLPGGGTITIMGGS